MRRLSDEVAATGEYHNSVWRTLALIALLIPIMCAVSLLAAGCGRHNGAPGVAAGPGALFDPAITLDSPAPEGISPALWQQLTSALRQVLDARDKTAAGLPPAGDTSITDFQIIADPAGTARASWSMDFKADYNPNGAVGVDDLVILGIFYGAVYTDDNWGRARAADGNRDRRIDLGDITPLGIHFGETVSGFEVQSADSLDAGADWTALQQDGYSPLGMSELDGVAQFGVAVPGAQAGRFYRAAALYSPPSGAPQYGPPSDAQRYYGGTAGPGAWPMGGHDPGRSFRSAAPGPSLPRVAWLHEINYFDFWDQFSAPVLGLDGSVYCASSHHVLALNPDGSQRWMLDQDANFCSEPVLGPDGVLYITFAGSSLTYLRALAPDGTRLWTQPIAAQASRALLADGVLYFHTNVGLACFSLQGEQLWELELSQADQTPYLPATQSAAGLIIFGQGTELFACATDGSLAWRLTLPGEITERVAAYSDGGVAVPLDTGVCAVSGAGALEWNYTDNRCTSNLACASDDSVRFRTSVTAYPPSYAMISLQRDGNAAFITPLPYEIFYSNVMLDSLDNTYLCNMYDDATIICIDTNGAILWDQVLSTAYDLELMCCSLGADGGLYFASSFGVLCLRDDGYGKPVPPALTASQGAFQDYVRLSWPASPHAESYRIYRDGAPLPLAEISELQYDDYSVLDDAEHSYTICGVNILGEGAPSAPITGYITLPPSREAAPGDWAMQGHDAQRTFRSNIAGPSAGVLQWSYETGDSTSIVAVLLNAPVFGHDGTVYLAANAGMLVALDPYGTELWRMQLGSSVSVPAIGADGTLYCVACQITADSDDSPLGYARVYAINNNRSVKWIYEESGDISGMLPSAAVTLDTGGNLHCQLATGSLVTLDASGAIISRISLSGSFEFPTAPLIGPEGNTYLFDYFIFDTHLYALDSAGTSLWDYDTSAGFDWGVDFMAGPPLVKDSGMIYVPGIKASVFDPTGAQTRLNIATGFANYALAEDGRVYSCNRADDSLGWLDDAGAYHALFSSLPADYSSLLLDTAGRIYVVSVDNPSLSAVLLCIDAQGEILWSANVEYMHPYSSMSLRDDGTLFFTTRNTLLAFADE